MAQPHNKAHRECILIEYSPGNCQQPNNASRIYSIAIRAEHVVGGSKNARHRRCALCVWNSSEKLYGIFSLFPSPSVHVYLFDLIFILMTVSHPGDWRDSERLKFNADCYRMLSSNKNCYFDRVELSTKFFSIFFLMCSLRHLDTIYELIPLWPRLIDGTKWIVLFILSTRRDVWIISTRKQK